MKRLIITLTACLSVFYVNAQFQQLFPGQDPDKCYSKYNIVAKPASQVSNTVELFQYIGDEDWELLQGRGVEEISIDIFPARKELVKVGGECSPENVWNQQEIAAEKRSFIVVKDTNLVRDFTKIKVKTYEIEATTSKMEWRECLCKDYISIRFKDKLKDALIYEGYPLNEVVKDCELMEALSAYQRANRLPQDHYEQSRGMSINMETIKALSNYF